MTEMLGVKLTTVCETPKTKLEKMCIEFEQSIEESNVKMSRNSEVSMIKQPTEQFNVVTNPSPFF